MILPAINRISCVRVWVGRNYNNGYNSDFSRQPSVFCSPHPTPTPHTPTSHTPHPTTSHLPLITDN
ncbi:MAG: hypothetical protein DWQ54_22510 [Microcystis flos-aquae TF09]|uniref:Uncharacterized protein n=1 Tax=Microcystis flos-aquae TF09 TaxID=2060473 RepID=A0A3E0KX91_9CHRO|nr:MAG: hypothetical protein DWQ54_22510 [Microcystis flos-aquae TF09]